MSRTSFTDVESIVSKLNTRTTRSGVAAIGAAALIMTVLGVASGHATEANPLVEWLIHQHGWGVTGVARGAAVALPLAVAVWARGRSDLYQGLAVPGLGLPALMYGWNAVSDAAVLVDGVSMTGIGPELAAAVAGYAVVVTPAVAPSALTRAARGAQRALGRTDTQRARAVGMCAIYLLSVVAVPLGGMLAAIAPASAENVSPTEEWRTTSGGTAVDHVPGGKTWTVSDSRIYAYDSTGTEVVNQSLSSVPYTNAMSLLVHDGTAYVGGHDDTIAAYDVDTGELLWSDSAGNNQEVHLRLLSDSELATNIGQDVTVYETDGTDSVAWTEAKSFFVNELSVGNGYLYAVGGEISKIDVETHDVVDSADSPGTGAQLTYHHGYLYGVDTGDAEIIITDVTDYSTDTISTSAGSLQDVEVGPTNIYAVDSGDQATVYVYDRGTYTKEDEITGVTSGSLWARIDVETTSSDSVALYGSAAVRVNVDVIMKSLTGTVETADGAPVADATVKVVAVNYERLSGDKREEARDLLAKMQSPVPPQWDADADLESRYESTGNEYVAVHPASDWMAGEKLLNNPDISTPHSSVPSGERVVISVWDPETDALDYLDADKVRSQLPGVPVQSDRDVVIQKLGPGGSVTDSYDFETNRVISMGSVGGIGEENYHVAVTRLPAGFYRVSTADSPFSTVIVVGSPDKIADNIRDDLRSEYGDLTEHAQFIRNKTSVDGAVRTWKTTTDANGEFSVDVPERYKTVRISAYKHPQVLNDANLGDRSIGELRERILASDINGSVYYTVAPERVDPPAQDVTVVVEEFGAGSFAEPSRFDDLWDRLEDRLANKSLSWWSDQVPGINQSETTDDLREKLDKYERQLNESERLLEQYKERLGEQRGKDPSEVEIDLDDDSESREELKEELRAVRRALEDLSTEVDTDSDTTASTPEDVAETLYTYRVVVGSDVEDIRSSVSKGDVVVTAVYNGERHIVPEQYISVSGVALGGSQVTVTDYPVPQDAPTVRFEMVGVTNSGDTAKNTGEATENPQFDETIPEIRSVDVSSLNPAPNSTVAVSVTPESETNYGNLTDVTVTASGETWNGTVTGDRTAEVPVRGPAAHQVTLTYTNANGTAFETTIPVMPRKGALERPTSIVSKRSKTGQYALTGGGLSGAKIQRSAGVVTVTAVVDAADAPNSFHVYPSGSSAAEKYAVSVVDNSGTAVRESFAVTMHTSKLPTGALVYYVTDDGGKEPLTSDPSIYGTVESGPTGSVITVYTDDGSASVKVVEDPTLTQQAIWLYETSIPDIPFLTILPMGAFAAVIPIGIFGREPRGDGDD